MPNLKHASRVSAGLTILLGLETCAWRLAHGGDFGWPFVAAMMAAGYLLELH